jgi:hypothetical protein
VQHAVAVKLEAGTLDSANLLMLRLDYLSCLLTILSTVMVGRRKWQGWLVAGANSVIISVIGLKTGQWGFVPANAFCIAIYLYNIRKWRSPENESAMPGVSDSLNHRSAIPAEHINISAVSAACRRMGRHTGDERTAVGNRIRARRISHRRESRTSY